MYQNRLVCVDLSKFETRKHEIVRDLMHAGQNVGFFYVCNHGIAQEAVDEIFALNEKLFALDRNKKERFAGDKSNKSYIMGYTAEAHANGIMREGFLAGYDHPKMAGLWPPEDLAAGYKEGVLAFMRQCHEVTQRIMSCFALGLGLPEDFFLEAMDPRHQDCGTAIYNNHYPSCEGKSYPDGLLRNSAHTDFEILTLLFQRAGQNGLEVCPGKGLTRSTVKSEGKWLPMDPIEGCITCNIGDALQYASDDRLKSTYHRVRVPKPGEYQGDRYSMAYFANVRDSTVLQGPLKKYPAITFKDILAKKQGMKYNKIAERDVEKLSPEEYLKFQESWPTGPEFEDEAVPAAALTGLSLRVL